MRQASRRAAQHARGETYALPWIEVVRYGRSWKNSQPRTLLHDHMLNDLKTQLGSSMQTMRAFLQRPIGVRRGGLGTPARSARSQAREAQRQRVRQMRRDLYQLMQQHPDSRQLMRHLDLVERTLRNQGYAAVEALPVRVIAKALTQLERLVWDWTPAGLAELRSRMAVTIKTRKSEAAQETPGSTTAPDFAANPQQHHHSADSPDVTELDHAAFEEMERSWAGRMPDAASVPAHVQR